MANDEAFTGEEALDLVAQLFHAQRLNCYIVTIVGFKTKINPNVIKAGLEHTLLKHPLFCSKIKVDEKEGRNMKWTRTTVRLENHVIVPNLDPDIKNSDQFVEDYVSNLTKNAMDMSQPLWELHLLNIKTSDAEAVGVFRIHHSIGDAEDEKDGGARQNNNNIPESIRLRAIVFSNIRPTAGIQAMAEMMKKGSKDKWGNEIGFVIVPLTIALHGDPLDYIERAKAKMERKKLSLEARCTFPFSNYVLKTFGVKVIYLPKPYFFKTKAAAALTHTVFTNTTVAFSNVVGPLEEISFIGHPIAFLAPSIYGFPHAITIHCQSYVNKMTIILAVDPNVVPHPHQLLDDIEESLQLIKDAALKRRSSKI
uniref:O-acyltransferase WSD1 C-terminal domain-containing protein n=1 Tax=Fagus sylvatica TaxID=28930 RepID=A0A2N9H7R3_FAGSY